MSVTDPRTARGTSTPKGNPPSGPDSLGGQNGLDTQDRIAAEGQTSPQATAESLPIHGAPAGSKTGRDHSDIDAQTQGVAANDFPGGHVAIATHRSVAAGDQTPSAAIEASAPKVRSLLADPLLSLSADVLDDLEKVRIANENRLRQLTQSAEDADGETRGFGLDESHPDVARLAALVGMLADAEHKAELNLKKLMRQHPLGPWVAAQKGVGEKQAARLIAAIGDPYIRPEIALEDGAVEPSRPRTVSELWALCGYHVVPAGQATGVTHSSTAGGELNGSDPGHGWVGTQTLAAGVAPKRQRGQRANWSANAKMRAFLVAESCIKQRTGSFRPVYDATRAKYANAVHAVECQRCGPKGKPAQPGSTLSDGHKHARAMRAVAKEVLKGLWREAKRIHLETPVSGQSRGDIQRAFAADGD